jgi:hypothetical protein
MWEIINRDVLGQITNVLTVNGADDCVHQAVPCYIELPNDEEPDELPAWVCQWDYG